MFMLRVSLSDQNIFSGEFHSLLPVQLRVPAPPVSFYRYSNRAILPLNNTVQYRCTGKQRNSTNCALLSSSS